MKKKIIISILAVAMLTMSACSNTNDATASRDNGYGTSSVSDVLNDKMAEENAKTASGSTLILTPSQLTDTEESTDTVKQTDTTADSQTDLKGYDGTETLTADEKAAMTHDGIDVDLTVLSSNMVYAEVYNMMVVPSDYEGKVVKMNGIYDTMYDENMDQHYYFCIIQDATACCAQGIEFILEDENAYPKPGSIVTVIGTFSTYMEGEDMYCTVKDAKII